MTEPSGDEETGRLIKFRHRRSDELPGAASPVEDLAKYEDRGEDDDYGHRMTVNIVALVFLAALVGGGIWLANSMAAIRKNQDCVLSGQRNCAQVNVERNRW